MTMNSVPSKPGGFFTELRRRRVLPIAGAYIAIAWLVTEIAGYVLEQTGAPPWSLRLLAIVFMVGFPITTVLAWIIQVGPDGKRTLDPSTGQRRTVPGAILLGIIATAGLAWLILPRIEEVPDIPGYEPIPNSVAILPLASPDATPNERTVAETLYSAIRAGLGQSRELQQVHLMLNTTPPDPPALGRRWQVAALLTGRIQSIPGGTRIELELLDVARNAVSWSLSLDWDPTLIADTGTEIANGVLETMGLPVLDVDQFTGTSNREAYDAFLEGVRYQESFIIEELRKSMDEFQRAIDLDPGYLLSYVRFAQTIYVYLRLKGPPESERQALGARQRELVDTAYRLDENDAETISLMGLLADSLDLQVQLYERALELDPDNGHTYFRLGWARFREGSLEEAERLFRRALIFNPQNANYHHDLGRLLEAQGRIEEAMAELDRSIDLNPRMPVNYQLLAAWNMFHFGRIDEAAIKMQKAYALDPESGPYASRLAKSYSDLAMEDEAIAWLEHALELSPSDAWTWALAGNVHRTFGYEQEAMQDYRRALELAPKFEIPLGTLAEMELPLGLWDQARQRWSEAYPELVAQDDPVIDEDNIGAVVWYSINLKQAGLEDELQHLLEKFREVIADMPPDQERTKEYQSLIAYLSGNLNPDAIIRDLTEQIIDHNQRTELGLDNDQLDIVRDDPRFQELVKIVEDDLAKQRERIRQMACNEELAPAPGVELIPNCNSTLSEISQ